MARTSTTITSTQNNQAIATIGTAGFEGTLNARGTFGGGTLTYQLSTDGGTTKTAMKDLSGNAYSATANDAVNVNIAGGAGNNNPAQQVQIYANLAGSTGATVTVDVLNNAGR